MSGIRWCMKHHGGISVCGVAEDEDEDVTMYWTIGMLSTFPLLERLCLVSLFPIYFCLEYVVLPLCWLAPDTLPMTVLPKDTK